MTSTEIKNILSEDLIFLHKVLSTSDKSENNAERELTLFEIEIEFIERHNMNIKDDEDYTEISLSKVQIRNIDRIRRAE